MSTGPAHWNKFIGLIQNPLREGCHLEEYNWQTILLISKVSGDFHEIGLVEVLCKAVIGIFNCRLLVGIQLHSTLHIFRIGRGTGTAYLKSKLLWQLIPMRKEVLYEIFLYLHKSYDGLD